MKHSIFRRVMRGLLFAAIPFVSTAAFAQTHHAYGALPPTETLAPPRPLPRAAPLPASVDLRKYAVPVGNQGMVNSCVAWTIAHAMMGWYAKSLNMPETAFAPMYMYSQINLVDLCPSHDCGSHPQDGFELARVQGVDTSSHYSWGDYNWWTQPTDAERANAANYKFGEWKTLFMGAGGADGMMAIKSALANNQPVAIDFLVRPGFDKLTPENDLDTDTTGKTGPIPEYHEVLAVGYDEEGLLIQNSWGTSWGNAGFGRLSWEVVQQDVVEADVLEGRAFPSTIVDVPTGVDGRILTPAQTGDTVNWVEIARNVNYALIVRSEFINTYPNKAMYGKVVWGDPRWQYTTFGTTTNYMLAPNSIRGKINDWFNGTAKGEAEKLPDAARLRNFTVQTNVSQAIGTSTWLKAMSDGFTKPTPSQAGTGDDVAFALSYGEAANFVSLIHFVRDNVVNGIYISNAPSSDIAKANYAKVNIPVINPYTGMWLRSPGDITNTVAFMPSATNPVGNGRVFQEFITLKNDGIIPRGLVYPAVWVDQDIFGGN